MPKVHPVKVALAERGETQRRCAEAVEVAPQVLTQVLNGHRRPWPALRRRLADHLGRDQGALFPEFSASESQGGAA